MNIHRWFAWLCLALMLGAELLLFRANHERDAAKADLAGAQQKLHMVQDELDALKQSAAGDQAAEIASLRKQNDALTTKVSALQNNLDQLQRMSRDTAQHLTTARDALAMQQANLQQIQAEQAQQQEAANTAACIANLRSIDTAKNLWALEKNKASTDVPTAQDLLPYLKDSIFPVCPDGGTYTINSMAELPTCSVPGHVMPQN